MNAVAPAHNQDFCYPKSNSSLKKSRAMDYYPQNADLPWHYGYIDDKMIGGMSIPSERVNYTALHQEGVRLIVNLTESPVSPLLEIPCVKCTFSVSDLTFQHDLFDDITEEHGIKVLFLPCRDGFIPTFKQVDIFLKYAKEAISKGEKVMVHCHAGVGRTGVYLAAYLMEKYSLSPVEALKKLRYFRPHSLQYNPEDWLVNPFILRHPTAYERNLLQERFLHIYYKRLKNDTEEDDLSSLFALTTLDENGSRESDPEYFEDPDLEKGQYVFVPEFTDEEVDFELFNLLSQMENPDTPDNDDTNLCYVCRNVLSVGPSLICSGRNWPPPDAEILYK